MNEEWSRRLRKIAASTGLGGVPPVPPLSEQTGTVPPFTGNPVECPSVEVNPFVGGSVHGAPTYGADEEAPVPASLTTPPHPKTRAPVRGAHLALWITAVVALVCAGAGAFWLLERPSAVAPSPGASTPRATPPATPPSRASIEEVNELLGRIRVVPVLPNVDGYERSCSPGKGCVFGPAWTDVARTGCDTRNRVLASQLRRVKFKPGTRDCKVVAGLLDDPYTGATIDFITANPREVEVDHVFALARAWDAGASSWPYDRRVAFANDTANLRAVSGKENARKSDSGPDTWMPPNQAFGCEFVMGYLTIAAKYELAITTDDEIVATQACSA